MNTICYLAQTSVEDGLLPIGNMKSFLDELEKCLQHYNLVLKFHPRSDRQMYNVLLSNKHLGSVIAWDEASFPEADMYIGHESTVVARAMDITAKTMVVRLNPERESPFEKYACFTKHSFNGLLDAVDNMAQQNDVEINSSFNEYVWNNPAGALIQTANDMVEVLSEKIRRRNLT